MLFFFAHTVFPLVSVFVILPAGAAACSPSPVGIADVSDIIQKFAAGDPLKEKASVLIVEVFSPDIADEMVYAATTSGTSTGSVDFGTVAAGFAGSDIVCRYRCHTDARILSNDIHFPDCVFRG